jgi:hypothetical protein
MAKKLTKNKAKEILHDKSVHGHPLTDKQRKFFGAIAGGAKPYENGGWLDRFETPSAQNGIEGTMGGLTDKGFNFNPAWGGAWRYGGELVSAQNGNIIYTDNPADPRLHSYLDSANLYKAHIKQLEINPRYVPQRPAESHTTKLSEKDAAKIKAKLAKVQTLTKKQQHEDILKEVKNPKIGFLDEEKFKKENPKDAALIDYYKTLTFSTPTYTGIWNTPDLVNESIAPTGIYLGGAINPVYSEPVEKVIYTGPSTDYEKFRSVPTIRGTNIKFKPPLDLKKTVNIPPKQGPAQKIETKVSTTTQTTTKAPLRVINAPSGTTGVFGPNGHRIGEYDASTNTFYADYEGIYGKTSDASKAAQKFINDKESLDRYIFDRTSKNPNVKPLSTTKQRNGGWMDKYENDGNISKAQNGKVKNKDAKWIEDAATKHQKCGIGIEDPTCKTEPTLQFPGMPTYENMSNPVNLWNWPEGRKEQKAFMSNVDTRQQILSQQYPNLTKEALITALRDSARTNQLLNNPGYTKLFDEQGKLKDSTVRVEPFIKYWKEAYPEKTKITVPDMLQYLGQNIGNYENLINSGYRKFEDGGMLQPPMAGADQTVPMYAMGGSLPGSVGFTYARTAGAAPANGPYAKKTKASAQNGQEMKFYQAGLDFTPKTISQDGTVIDPMGYWNPENIGNPVIIPSTDITMEGVDVPLIGISDTGDVQYMEPGEDYEFDGEYVTEYPVAKKGISVNNADAQPLKKLDQLLNFTNYNKPTKGGWLDKYN